MYLVCYDVMMVGVGVGVGTIGGGGGGAATRVLSSAERLGGERNAAVNEKCSGWQKKHS